MTEYYTFEMGDRNAGYFELSDDGREVFMCAMFKVDGVLIENPFWYWYSGSRVTQHKAGDGQWVAVPDHLENHYPTAAYPLFVREGIDSYVALIDSTGEVEGKRELRPEGEWIIETSGQAITRKFQLQEKHIIEIDWGGPISRLKESKEAAVAGSDL